MDEDDKLLSAQDKLSPCQHKEVAEKFVLLLNVEEFIIALRVDDNAEDKLLSVEGEDKILVVLGREESKSGVRLPPLHQQGEQTLLSIEEEGELLE